MVRSQGWDGGRLGRLPQSPPRSRAHAARAGAPLGSVASPTAAGVGCVPCGLRGGEPLFPAGCSRHNQKTKEEAENLESCRNLIRKAQKDRI